VAAAVDLAAPEVAEAQEVPEVPEVEAAPEVEAVLAEAEVHPGNALPDQEK
jgi:hypothetical protein